MHVLLACMLDAGKAVSDPCVTLQQLLFDKTPLYSALSIVVPAVANMALVLPFQEAEMSPKPSWAWRPGPGVVTLA